MKTNFTTLFFSIFLVLGATRRRVFCNGCGRRTGCADGKSGEVVNMKSEI